MSPAICWSNCRAVRVGIAQLDGAINSEERHDGFFGYAEYCAIPANTVFPVLVLHKRSEFALRLCMEGACFSLCKACMLAASSRERGHTPASTTRLTGLNKQPQSRPNPFQICVHTNTHTHTHTHINKNHIQLRIEPMLVVRS